MLKIAIIGAGTLARVYAIRAKELHIESFVFAWKENAIAKDYADHFYDISIFEKEKITEICKEQNICGVLATTEKTIAITSYIADQLHLNCLDCDVAEKITNKFWVRERASKLKVLCQPKYSHLQKNESADIKNFPVIVKPASAGGKRGIAVIRDMQGISAGLAYAREASNEDGMIVEEFLDGGCEYSVESLSFHGRHFIVQVTQKDTSGAPHCVELGHHQPADVSAAMREKVVAAISELLDAVGVNYGPCHTEIKIINGNVYLIELNARPGGDRITYPLTELSTGYKYISGIIFSAMDILYSPEIYSGKPQFAGIYFITKQTEAMKKTFDECDGKPWLYEKHKVSDTLQEISGNDDEHLNYFIYAAPEMPSFK